MTTTTPVTAPTLPTQRGPVSRDVVAALTQSPGSVTAITVPTGTDPIGGDAQLALTVLYELAYRGFDGVDDRWEWDPALLTLRARLEDAFLDHVRANVAPGDDAVAEMDLLSVAPSAPPSGPSAYLLETGTWDQMREYFAHRSIYHLKEADPHAWAIPRLSGQAKASFVAVQFDEYGGGRRANMHQQMWSDLMAAADLDTTYLGYLNRVPAATLAWVNLMSLFGLHRSLRGATIGHFAATEITSSPGSARLVDALNRMNAPEPCVAFYAEHVVADAVHEQVVRTDVVGNLIVTEPSLEADIVFGMRALDYVEELLAEHIMQCWTAGRSSLLEV